MSMFISIMLNEVNDIENDTLLKLWIVISEEVIEWDLMMIKSFDRMIIQSKDVKSDLTQAFCILLVIIAIFQAYKYNFMKFDLLIEYSAFNQVNASSFNL